jgi:filamentous hemagglutinin family protein
MTCTPRTHARRAQCIQTLLLSGLVLLSALLTVSRAQITLDGSLGPRGPLSGPNYRIGAELGQMRGSNLFHSFGQFNVPTGGSATFSGPPAIANIVSRVTGGQPSAIDGALRSEIPGANLYLLNPSGSCLARMPPSRSVGHFMSAPRTSSASRTGRNSSPIWGRRVC